MSWEELLKRKVSGKRVDHLPKDDYDAIRETLLEYGRVTVYSAKYAEKFPDAFKVHINSDEEDTVFKMRETSKKIANTIVSPLEKDKIWGSPDYTYKISGSADDFMWWFKIKVEKGWKDILQEEWNIEHLGEYPDDIDATHHGYPLERLKKIFKDAGYTKDTHKIISYRDAKGNKEYAIIENSGPGYQSNKRNPDTGE